jgi:branched-chain amino acid transport system ATP-binding protein
MLETKNLHVFYGGIHALKGINLRVPIGKIVALVGANGAGQKHYLKDYIRSCERLGRVHRVLE